MLVEIKKIKYGKGKNKKESIFIKHNNKYFEVNFITNVAYEKVGDLISEEDYDLDKLTRNKII